MPIFFEADPEYPDLDCCNAAKKYADLVDPPFGKGRKKKTPLLPTIILPKNLTTSSRKISSATATKVLEALKVCSTFSSEMYVYQLFYRVKELGYRYNYRSKIWEPE